MKKWIVILLIGLILLLHVISSIISNKVQLNSGNLDACITDARILNPTPDHTGPGQTCIDWDAGTQTCYRGTFYIDSDQKIACGRNNLRLLRVLEILRILLFIGALICLFFYKQ